ncbi:hypothetical protein BDY19DRAFT_916890 [Irpex rosettiformis]|uniref:Uncharacterized protein n=1 Tax=Irpex rosettiformis TaxID=378272 RepID=A0ACB8ULJ8_9APHY|nr:hypothetical protein BDY19DRAFT_916890 [Irpex rosettiformis]
MYKLSTVFFALFVLFIGQAVADPTFNITLNAGGIVNVTADQFLAVNDQALLDTCKPNMTAAMAAIGKCANSDAACLCDHGLTALVGDTEQCYFNKLVKDNRPMPGGDIRAGGQTALTAYLNACKGSNVTNLTATDFTLTLAPNWDGPFGQGLNTATTAITLIAALLLGGGCIGTLLVM